MPSVLDDLVKRFLCDRHSSSLGFSNSIACGAIELSALKGLIDAECCLRRAEKEIAVGFQNPSNLGEDFFLGFDAEINQYVPDHHDVHRRQYGPGAREIEDLIFHHVANVVPQIPIASSLLKVFHQQTGGKSAVHFELAIASLARPSEDIR